MTEDCLFTCYVCHARFRIEAFGDGKCPKCHRYYDYDDTYRIRLSVRDVLALRALDKKEGYQK